MASSRSCYWSLVLTVIVVSVLVIWLTGTSTASDNNDKLDADRILTSPLFDVGRLWLRATAQQSRRVIDVLLLMLTTAVAKLVFAAVGAFVLIRLYRFFFVPIDRVKLLGDVGYINDSRQSMKDLVEQVKRRRAVGDVPPVYPNGWFALIESRCLKVGEVKNVCCLGKMLSSHRTE